MVHLLIEGNNVDATTTATLVLIKPDALKLGLTGYLLSSLSRVHAGLYLAGAKIVHVSRLLAEEHYHEHRGKPFFDGLIEYLQGRIHYPEAVHKRRVVALVYAGAEAIGRVREITGPTNPHTARDQQPGSLRALGTIVTRPGSDHIERIDNLVHASANAADAEREVKLWFRPLDIMPGMHLYGTEVCEQHFYYRDGLLSTEHRIGDTCLLAPGDLAWGSDMDALRQIAQGEASPVSLDSVVAKYLINARLEE
jgi:nucleoside-diphosphate kinase